MGQDTLAGQVTLAGEYKRGSGAMVKLAPETDRLLAELGEWRAAQGSLMEYTRRMRCILFFVTIF